MKLMKHMKNKNMFLAIFMGLIVVFLIVQTINPAFATSSDVKKVLDKGDLKIKNTSDMKIYWKSYKSSNNKKVVVFRYYTKKSKNWTSDFVKTSIKKVKYNKLEITRISPSVNMSSAVVYYIWTKNSPKTYYYNIFQPKMLKNAIKTLLFDKGYGEVYNEPHTGLYWRINIKFDNKKLYVYEDKYGMLENLNKRAIIKQYAKNKLKIFTISNSTSNLSPVYSSSGETEIIEKTNLVSTKLSPKNYYLNVYKPKMLKYVKESVRYEAAMAKLKNSSKTVYFNTNVFINKKLTVSFGSNTGNFNGDIETLIEIAKKNKKLKITTFEVINKTTYKRIKYVNTNLNVLDYYLKVYKLKLIKKLNESTIVYFSN